MFHGNSLPGFGQVPSPDISGGLAVSRVWSSLILSCENIQECASQVFSDTTTNVGAVCEDQIDGPMDGGVDTQIINPMDRECWVPRRLSDNSVLESKYDNIKHNVTAWTVGGTVDLVVIGFSDPGSGKTFYTAVLGTGLLRLTTDGDDPESLSESEARDDERVMRYFWSKKLNGYVLRSVKHKLFITKYSRYVMAKDIDEKNTTTWNIA